MSGRWRSSGGGKCRGISNGWKGRMRWRCVGRDSIQYKARDRQTILSCQGLRVRGYSLRCLVRHRPGVVCNPRSNISDPYSIKKSIFPWLSAHQCSVMLHLIFQLCQLLHNFLPLGNLLWLPCIPRSLENIINSLGLSLGLVFSLPL